MKVSSLSVVLIALSAAAVNAIPGNIVPFPKNLVTTKTWTYSTKACSTSSGSKPCGGKVPTSVFTKKQTIRPIVYKTVTPTTYSTPTKYVTVKSTVTATVKATITLPPVTETLTDTVSETSTLEETTTIPSYVTETATVYETVTVSFDTIHTEPAPPGFLYPNPGQPTNHNLKKRDSSLQAGDVEYNPDVPAEEIDTLLGNIEKRTYKKKYPVKVYCTVYLGVIIPKTSTRTAKTKTILKPAKTITKTNGAFVIYETSFITESPTVTVDATSTDSTSTTTTVTEQTPSTVTETVTETRTETIPQETYYEACGPRNLVSQHTDGRLVEWLLQTIGDLPYQVPASSAYECCAQCMKSHGCYGARYSLRSGVWGCSITAFSREPDVCEKQTRHPGTYRLTGVSLNTYVINGPCGQWDYI